jgi:hypothetical protein
MEPPPDADEYRWVITNILTAKSFYTSAGRLSTLVGVKNTLEGDWELEAPINDNRVCISYEGCCLPLYEVLIKDL